MQNHKMGVVALTRPAVRDRYFPDIRGNTAVLEAGPTALRLTAVSQVGYLSGPSRDVALLGIFVVHYPTL